MRFAVKIAAMPAPVVCVIVLLAALTACDSKPMTPDPGGGNGGPTPPGPIATTGTITGSVTTSAGAGVGDARIFLGSTASATTAASGEYRLADVPPGTHSLTLAPPRLFRVAAGEAATKQVAVTAGQASTVNWSVTAAPPPGPIIVIWVVDLEATRFNPSDITIARGNDVLWINRQPIFHTISPDDRNQPGAWRTQNIAARTNESFSHTFDTAGTFHYSCTVHPGMTGVVRVR